MIPTLVRLALSQRWLVLMLAGMLVALGVWAFQHQQIDAYPDISGQMVEVITTYPGKATEEVERQVTIPIEIAMRTVPRVEVIRSRTIFGLSIVDVLFQEGTENYWVRQRVHEKLDDATLPDGVKPDLAPLATAYGEIYRYELVSDGTARPDGAAHAQRLGGRSRGCCAAPAWPTSRISAATPSNTRRPSTPPSCSATAFRWATSWTPSSPTTPAPAAASYAAGACRS